MKKEHFYDNEGNLWEREWDVKLMCMPEPDKIRSGFNLITGREFIETKIKNAKGEIIV